ncbi:cyclohexanecarboxyl-CoA dehydrogenase [Advenella alkanexedens]|uniref:Cyclohexanecarboxyl-CoA dehydrogenase n=1 Tax=Advenella alkanexedens TaxID=1481665 RepID=A0ABS6NQY6_9BURK|nr:cyclohexanecarboxyl-CoA dehydrogenase [Advenella alkanexedens]MBV4398048.1 cyclohexanecarboxyl-CoA dehydrogenase [Advenella alkanexedens]
MEFSITEDQRVLVESAGRFAREVLAPGYQHRDKTGRLERDIVRQMGELGLLGVEMPEAYGGMGMDCVTSGLLLEQLSASDFNMAYVSLLVSLCGQIVNRFASESLKQEWLPKIIAGEKLIAIALTEPSAGSDAAALQLKAVKEGDHYVLTGEKTSISLADQADVAVVFARTNSGVKGAKGISAFLVPMDLPGITRTAFDDLGTRCVGRGSIFFDGVKVPASHMLGEEDKGFTQVMQGFDYSRALIGLQCLAVARASLDETWEYAKERETFGKPIVENQGVSFPLAEYETYYQAARLVCLETLWLKDKDLPHTSQAAMCKWWGPKLSYDIIYQCLLFHGHGGYAKDYPYEQRLRDVLGLQIGDGTAQIMKMIIARTKTGLKLS